MNYDMTNTIISPIKEPEIAPLCSREWGWGKERRDRSVSKEGDSSCTNAAGPFGVKPDASSKPSYRIFAPPSNTFNMSESKKQEQDFTKEVDQILPPTTKLAKVSYI